MLSEKCGCVTGAHRSATERSKARVVISVPLYVLHQETDSALSSCRLFGRQGAFMLDGLHLGMPVTRVVYGKDEVEQTASSPMPWLLEHSRPVCKGEPHARKVPQDPSKLRRGLLAHSLPCPALRLQKSSMSKCLRGTRASV